VRYIPDRGKSGKGNLLAMHIEKMKDAERQRDEAVRLVTALRFELELERQRSAALQFQLDVYKERNVV
jgi:hypothetical protein